MRRRRTIEELAEEIGVAPSTLCDWENDKMHPRHARLATIAEVLGVSLHRLFA